MQQVRTLAIESAKSLRLSWDNHPRLWRDLLLAAREPDDAALEALRREAKLHFCGELIQLVEPAALPAFDFNTDDFAGNLAAHGIEDFHERPDLSAAHGPSQNQSR